MPTLLSKIMSGGYIMDTREKYFSFIFTEFRRLSQLKKIKLANLIYLYNKKYIWETKNGLMCNMEKFSDSLLEIIYNFIVVNIYGGDIDNTESSFNVWIEPEDRPSKEIYEQV